jgi:hypothetical protein
MPSEPHRCVGRYAAQALHDLIDAQRRYADLARKTVLAQPLCFEILGKMLAGVGGSDAHGLPQW